MATTKKSTGFSAEEKAAARERAKELRASQKKEELAKALLEKIAEMPEAEGRIARQVHELVTDIAPQLTAKTWYGMPAYADADGNVIVFFQGASKFGARYSTIGFNDRAQLDEGNLWPTVWAVTKLTKADEKKVRGLISRATGGKVP